MRAHMKVAFITFEYPPFLDGGAGVYASNITQELSTAGVEVHVFTPLRTGSPPENDDISHIHWVDTSRTPLPIAIEFWLKLPRAVKQVHQRISFDIIHFNGLSHLYQYRLPSDIVQIATIHHLVQSAIRENKSNLIEKIFNIHKEDNIFLPFLELHLLRNIDGVIAVSEYTRNEILNSYSLSPSAITMIHNGADHYDFDVKPLKDLDPAIKNELESCRPTFLFVGRVDDERKGLKFLLRSFSLLINGIDATLLVVGKGSKKQPVQLARELGIVDDIIFMGKVKEQKLKQYYVNADVFVSSSSLEGFGLTIQEALAAGCQVVATNVGGVPELVSTDDKAILVEPDDKEQLSEAMMEAVENLELEEFSGPNTATPMTKWEETAKKTISFYRERIRNTKPGKE